MTPPEHRVVNPNPLKPENWLARRMYSDSRPHSSVAIAELIQAYVDEVVFGTVQPYTQSDLDALFGSDPNFGERS